MLCLTFHLPALCRPFKHKFKTLFMTEAIKEIRGQLAAGVAVPKLAATGPNLKERALALMLDAHAHVATMPLAIQQGYEKAGTMKVRSIASARLVNICHLLRTTQPQPCHHRPPTA